MIRKGLALLTWCVLATSPVLSVAKLLHLSVSHHDWNALINHGVFTAKIIQLFGVIVILFAWFLTVATYIQGVRIRKIAWHQIDKQSLLPVCGVAIASFLSMGPRAVEPGDSDRGAVIDIHSLVAPTIAGVAAVQAAKKSPGRDISSGVAVMLDRRPDDDVVNQSDNTVIDTWHEQATVSESQSMPQWAVIVRLFGYPQVEDVNGRVGEFRKKKALELLLWLSINRDRPRRSAARTAMWEADISDSSFATIVSDLRRGLSELCPHVPARQWAPPTFNDEIVLSSLVITDVELLSDALHRFQRDSSTGHDLVGELEKIRDLPFAGAGYGWPDVDGSTTRFVILGANAAREAAYWAYENKEWHAVTVAITAGLRLLPGDEELLDLQRLVLQSADRRLH